MTWFPIGPDFVYTPRDSAPPLRLSRRNQYARQTRVTAITVDPSAPNIIYTIDADLYPAQPKGGTGAFRSDDGGQSWTSISDSLQQSNPSLNPTCIAVHPVNGNVIYLGTDTGAIYVSNTSGATWNPPQTPAAGASIVQIVVDPRNANNPATTVVYAGTANGLYVSTTGGASWGATPVLAGQIFSMAFSLPLAGTPECYVGVAYQGVYYTTNPTTAGWTAVTGLLAPNTFIYVWVGFCQANSSRAYAYFGNSTTGPLALYTTGHGGTNWKQVITTLPPYIGLFAIAPNSPGDGHGDILFVGGHLQLFRSTDAGQTWATCGDYYHVDQHAVAFTPANPPPGTIPTTLVGCDGGLIGSTGFSDPAYSFAAAPTDFSDGASYTNSGVAQNLNHGKLTSALHAYNGDPAASAIGYIVSDDTGLAGHTSALGWRGLENADGTAVAATPGSGGVKVWANLGFPFFTYLFTDTGNPGDLTWPAPITLGGNNISSSSNHILTIDKSCMTGIQQGCVVKIDQNGAATQISQVFTQPPISVAASTTDPTLLCCATQDNRVFVTQGVALGPGTVWNEATAGRPANPTVGSVAIDLVGNVYVLLAAVPGGSTTPLYKISGGTWTAQPASGLPAGPFGRPVADPIAAGTMYAVSDGRVYRLVLGAGTWNWAEIGPGLPGPHVEDLWIGNIASGGTPKVLLRAAIGSRGVWETDVTAGATDPSARPYVRDHFLDQGWLSPSPDGLVNPFRPSDGVSVFHYQCADIKIDAQHPGSPAFFQTDPEGTLPPPLSHVLFDMLNDNSQNLPGSDAAMVHVQVHNRSYAALNNVSVWAIYASAAAGMPGLNNSPSMANNFLFWNQFQANGTIVPNLPSDSPWTSVGAPATLSGIDVSHPQVASWNWTVPLLMSGDPGHYCMVVFLHSAENPINETTNYNVDSITPTNRQIGQKNLHIGPPLPARRVPGGQIREYIEFHNPGPESRVADLVFDLRPLPPELHMWLRLSELQTEAPLEQSMTGIAAVHRPGLADEAKAALLAGLERGEEFLEWLEKRLDKIEHKLEEEEDGGVDKLPRYKRHPELRFTRPVYRAKPASLVSVRGVRLPAHGVGAALMVVANGGDLPPGSEYRFQVQQVVRGRVIGGSTYVVRTAEPRP